MDRWSGKVAVVTGASGGIGQSIIKGLVQHGMKVVGLSRRMDMLDALAGRVAKLPGSFYPVKCDLEKEEDILEAFRLVQEKFGFVDVLINNAGFLVSEPIIDGKTEDFKRILDVNVLAVAICTREAIKLMRQKNNYAHIININSVAGHDAARIKIPVSLYSSSKYAVTGMCESIRNELSHIKSKIKITSISPGAVKTDMIIKAGIPADMIDRAPILEPSDINDAVIYVLGTPPRVQINELTITPFDETVQNATVSPRR